MRILLVDDETQCASAVARELREDYHHQVTLAANPVEAVQALERTSFDVVVNDVLYGQQGDARDDYNSVRTRRANPEPIKSGLWTIRHIRAQYPGTGIVVWTVGDSERRLHLRYAYEEYGVRVFCSKSSPTGNDKLQAAIISAQAGRRFIDGSIQWYVALDRQPTLRQTILKEDARTILRAMAAGALDYDDVAAVTVFKKSTLRNKVGLIAVECLPVVQHTSTERGNPKDELIAFANANRSFFADEAALRDYPNKTNPAV